MKSQLLFVPVVAALCGCGAWYEDVPAFGQTDPTYAQVQQQAPIQQVQAQANQATAAVDPGQPVDQAQQDEYTDEDPAALTDFKQTLDPYGTWADDPTYGTVWQPDPSVVGADFQPYVTDGYWGYDNDYIWVSNFDWGWAPFHYGRWAYINGRGWSWVPGRRYAGAWVGWRTGADGYIGWGPLPPTWGWRNGSAFNYGFATRTPYAFCATGDLFSHSLRDRVLAGPQVNTIAANTHDWVRDPNVHTIGPAPNRLGIAPPPFDRNVTGGQLARAQGFARPSTAIGFGARVPATWDRPVATAPRYVGAPSFRPYQTPYQTPYRYGAGRSYTVPSYGGRVYGGGPVYGGGYHGGYAAPMAPMHSYSHSYSRGGGFGGFHGGGGFRGGGGFHGGGGHGGGHR